MPRVVLIHWKPAEGEERAAALREAGYDAAVLAPANAAELRALRACPPDAFIIDLTRLPSQGRAVALDLRCARSTSAVPIVFAGGEPEKIARARELLPEAVFAEWSGMAGALGRAIAQPPSAPARRTGGAMAAYSGAPLVKKLGIRENSTVALLGAPEGFETALAPLPDGVRLARQARGGADIILLFARSRAEAERRFGGAARALKPRGGLWLVWPKQASGLATDLTQAAVRSFGLDAGLVDYKICAVDQTWSGLLFARRRVRMRLGG